MIKDCITYLNAKLATLGYFNEVICLAEKVEREGRVYPALYNGGAEYKEIQLDSYGSVAYWRKAADVTITEQENITLSKNVQYEMNVPLKLVCFIPKTVYANDQYFADTLAIEIMSYLTTNNSALKSAMKAKKVSVVAKEYKTDSREVGAQEYDNINFEARYTHAYFSIDFDLKIVTNNQCYSDICLDVPINFGYVTILDTNGDVVTTVLCGGEYVCTGGGSAAGTIYVYLDGVLQSTTASSDLDAETVNITWI